MVNYRMFSRFCKRWKCSLLAFVIGMPLIILTVSLAYLAEPRDIIVPADSCMPAGSGLISQAQYARDEAMERGSLFEGHMVSIGTIQLLIVAYIGGLILAKEADIRRRKLFFALTILILSVTTAAYMHCWKIYINYGTYAMILEAKCWESGFRITSNVVTMANNPNLYPVPDVLLWPIRFIANSLAVVAIYPVPLLLSAVLIFGKRLDIKTDIIAFLLVLISVVVTIYVVPDICEFYKMANLVRNL